MWLCAHGAEDVVLVVHRRRRAMISCWPCDAKPRKHHLWSVSFSNHKRLKLHMCIWWCLLKSKVGEGEGREKKNPSDVCLTVGLWSVSSQSLQPVVREASWVEMHLFYPQCLTVATRASNWAQHMWPQGEGQHERQLWWQQWPELSSSNCTPENHSGDSFEFQSMLYH